MGSRHSNAPPEKELHLHEAVKSIRKETATTPYKPLLLLYIFKRVEAGLPRLVPFAHVRTPLRRLMDQFAPPDKKHPTEPHIPFWHLRNDSQQLWELDRVPESSSRPYASELVRWRAQGGLPSETYELLRDEADALEGVIGATLAYHFPTHMHEQVIRAVHGAVLDSPS